MKTNENTRKYRNEVKRESREAGVTRLNKGVQEVQEKQERQEGQEGSGRFKKDQEGQEGVREYGACRSLIASPGAERHELWRLVPAQAHTRLSA